jgi:hypothetical protein
MQGVPTKSVEETDVSYSQVHQEQPILVDMGKTTTRDHNSYLKSSGLADDKCTLEYDPNKDFILPRPASAVYMKQTSSRRNHFMTKHEEQRTMTILTSDIDNYIPPSTFVPAGDRIKVDDAITGTLHASIDLTKTTGRSGFAPRHAAVPEIKQLHNAHHMIMYNKSYNQTDGQHTTDYNMSKTSRRRPGFKYTWLLHNFNENPKHYYDSLEKRPMVGVPSIKKSTGRKTLAPDTETNDLDYNPKSFQKSVPSMDLFLNSGRMEDVGSVAKAVDNLLARVSAEMRRNGIRNKVRKPNDGSPKGDKKKRATSAPARKSEQTQKHGTRLEYQHSIEIDEEDLNPHPSPTKKLSRGISTADHFAKTSSLLEIRKSDTAEKKHRRVLSKGNDSDLFHS